MTTGGEGKHAKGESGSTSDKGTSAKAGAPRDRIVDALMSLAARRDFQDVTISDIAHEAGVSLADFRDLFPSKGAILAAFSRKIDRQVLDAIRDEATHPRPRGSAFTMSCVGGSRRSRRIATDCPASCNGPRAIHWRPQRSTVRSSTPCASCWRPPTSTARAPSAP